MAASEGRWKWSGTPAATPTALTISLAPGGVGLASSTSGVGRQSTIVTGNYWDLIYLFLKIKLGAGYTANKNIYVHLIRSDGTRRSDGAGASDAGLTIVNAAPLGPIRCPSGLSGNLVYKEILIRNPGPEWGIALSHDTGVALDPTESNHEKYWIGGLVENQ